LAVRKFLHFENGTKRKKSIGAARNYDEIDPYITVIITLMHHSLFKYYDQHEWAEEFVRGQMLFRSLSYFRDYEDAVRGDEYEGTSKFLPDGGLQIHNHTQGTRFTLPHAFESTVRSSEIFVFCTSRILSESLARDFNALTCVEIRNIKTLCTRIRAGLPPTATFMAKRVDYYPQSQAPNPRWALPDAIATSKLDGWAWQHEYRFVFSFTDALGFEKVDLRLTQRKERTPPKPEEHLCYRLEVGSLRDICRLRVIKNTVLT
jgi:hypothetical protein